MIAVGFNGFNDAKRYRGTTPEQCSTLRRRWTYRAQIWGLDKEGRPARFSATMRSPKAMRIAELAASINSLLEEVAMDMREALGSAPDSVQHVAASWLAVSESPAKKDKRSR